MIRDDFKRSTAGKLIRVPAGFYAYVPNPLPPTIKFDQPLVNALSDADQAIGRLAGVAGELPNPALLSAPARHIEAVESSRIEGTTAEIHDLYMFESIGAAAPDVSDVLEVANYLSAMEVGLRRLGDLPLCVRLVREIHAELMKDVRGGYATPGEFRVTPNWIGPPGCTLNDATFVPPPPEEMREALSQWERYLNSGPQEPVLIQAALTHYQFEAIHPFLDGNGRVGRLLITLLLIDRGALPYPLLALSSYFERNRSEYYRLLLEVSRSGCWNEWITFFLDGVVAESRRAVDASRSLTELYTDYTRLSTGKSAPKITGRLVERLFDNPVVIVSSLVEILETTVPTLQRAVTFLVDKGVLEEITGRRRNRIYVARQIMRIIVSA